MKLLIPNFNHRGDLIVNDNVIKKMTSYSLKNYMDEFVVKDIKVNINNNDIHLSLIVKLLKSKNYTDLSSIVNQSLNNFFKDSLDKKVKNINLTILNN